MIDLCPPRNSRANQQSGSVERYITLQLFDESVNLTNGGPAGTTMTMSHYIYNNAFGTGVANFGYASAMSFLVFILVAVLAVINLKVGDSRD